MYWQVQLILDFFPLEESVLGNTVKEILLHFICDKYQQFAIMCVESAVSLKFE